MKQQLRRAVINQLARTGQLERALHARHVYRTTRDETMRRYRLRSAPASLALSVRDVPDTIITTVGTRPSEVRTVVARCRTSASVLDAMRSNRNLVTKALTATGVKTHELPIDSRNRFRVAVVHDRDRLLWSLVVAAPRTTYVYFDSTSIPRHHRVHHLASSSPDDLHRYGSKAAVWRIFEYHADPDGVDLFGDIHGCEIEFWRRSRINNTVRSRRWNPLTVELPAERFGSVGAGGDLPAPMIEAVDFPIDVVYTWVDGSDPEWIERRATTLGLVDLASRHEEAATDARYLSRNELKYSLRSLERYADFVNHVYVVTDDQCPDWLRTDHPRLSIVDHREIFPVDSVLPTFNSHSIESRLHHVPGLSEHYLYLNDDFFFARRVEAEQFFLANGLARFFRSRALIPLGEPTVRHRPVDTAAMNGRRVLVNKFGKVATRKFKHAPYPQLRSVQLDIADLFPDEVTATTASQVRSPTDLALASSLHHHVAYLTGRAIPGSLSSYYADLGQFNLEGRLHHLMKSRRYDTFCLNDTDRGEVSEADKMALVSAFFDTYFPEKSTFER